MVPGTDLLALRQARGVQLKRFEVEHTAVVTTVDAETGGEAERLARKVLERVDPPANSRMLYLEVLEDGEAIEVVGLES